MIVLARLKEHFQTSLAWQLFATFILQAVIISWLLQTAGQGSALGVILTVVFSSIVTGLLAAHSVERRLQHFRSLNERWVLEGRGTHHAENPQDESVLEKQDSVSPPNSNSEKQSHFADGAHIASLGPWRYNTEEGTVFWSQEVFSPNDPESDGQCLEEFLISLNQGQATVVLQLFDDLEIREQRGFDLIINQPCGTQRRCWLEVQLGCNDIGERLLTGACRDVADGGVALAQLREAQKVETARELSRGIAHDLNNLLSITVGNLDLLEEQLEKESSGSDLVTTALSAAMRAADLTKGLLALARERPAGMSTPNPTSDLLSSGTKPPMDEPMAPGSALGSKNIVVLVVEDEDDVRKTVERQLGDLGYKVVCASNAADALGVLDDGFRIDLLFTDIVMEGEMDGVGLARQALAMKPSLKVLHTSGYTSASEQAGQEVKRLLTKPYRTSTLASAIETTLKDTSDEEFRI